MLKDQKVTRFHSVSSKQAEKQDNTVTKFASDRAKTCIALHRSCLCTGEHKHLKAGCLIDRGTQVGGREGVSGGQEQ